LAVQNTITFSRGGGGVKAIPRTALLLSNRVLKLRKIRYIIRKLNLRRIKPEHIFYGTVVPTAKNARDKES
jgi:hypothetical protein